VRERARTINLQEQTSMNQSTDSKPPAQPPRAARYQSGFANEFASEALAGVSS
jgi:hypothetical protein